MIQNGWRFKTHSATISTNELSFSPPSTAPECKKDDDCKFKGRCEAGVCKCRDPKDNPDDCSKGI